jgi:hypothetical protein
VLVHRISCGHKFTLISAPKRQNRERMVASKSLDQHTASSTTDVSDQGSQERKPNVRRAAIGATGELLFQKPLWGWTTASASRRMISMVPQTIQRAIMCFCRGGPSMPPTRVLNTTFARFSVAMASC